MSDCIKTTEKYEDLAKRAVHNVLDVHMAEAIKKHPVFADDLHQALNVITEEMLELARAVNDAETYSRIMSEAADVATTATRLCIMIQIRIWAGENHG